MRQYRVKRQYLIYGFSFVVVLGLSLLWSTGFSMGEGRATPTAAGTAPGTIPGPFHLFLPSIAGYTNGTIPPPGEVTIFFPLIANATTSRSE